MRVLIVEDDPDLQESLEELLCVYDFSVVTASNYVDGMTIMDEGNVDVAIIDGSFPYSFGGAPDKKMWSHMATIADDHNIPTVIYSGDDDTVSEANWKGHIALRKPAPIADILDAIKAAVIQCQGAVA